MVLAAKARAHQNQIMQRLLGDLETNYRADSKAASAYIHQGESPVPANLNEAQLAAYTGVASLILNLDETITKE